MKVIQGKERIEPKAFGSTAYLTAKARGDNSMPTKRGTPEGVYGVVPRDPRDMVRARLLEPQPPATQKYVLRPQRPISGAIGIWRQGSDRQNLPADGAVRKDLSQGDERGTYVVLERPEHGECGIAYGARALRRRSLHISLRMGKPFTWRREAGVVDAPGEGGTRDA